MGILEIIVLHFSMQKGASTVKYCIRGENALVNYNHNCFGQTPKSSSKVFRLYLFSCHPLLLC